jgi:hypothetical protein
MGVIFQKVIFWHLLTSGQNDMSFGILSCLLEGESFENIIKKLIHAKFQLFNTFLTFSQENFRIFQENSLANLKKIKI